ncbi:MFS transporter [Flammeovirgaceae bacterium SG7u.111]|nr:MFS transporter [Flammeovirgaceae bacterium SG7u.132]WPO35309.1 MFS transporter [Flammeovirgaceae bacterium SG7u.111]
MNYIQVIKGNPRILLFGFLMTFFSSFGQTYVHAQFVPSIMKAFDLSNTAFGSIYAIGTVCGGFTLVYVGKKIDTVPLNKFTFTTVVGLILSLLVLSLAPGAWMLCIGFFINRLCGQGLFTHISLTTIAKSFTKLRGKALSVAVMGHAAGQAIFPITISLLIAYVGWQHTLWIEATIITLVLIPTLFYIFKKGFKIVEKKGAAAVQADTAPKPKSTWSRKEILKDPRTYLILPGAFSIHFLITGYHFYQVEMALSKGWAGNWIAACFIVHAIARAVSSIYTGVLIDKYSAVKLMPYFLTPFMIGLLLFMWFNNKFIAIPYLIGIAATAGMMASLNAAVLAEMFGVENLGGIKSMYSTLTVISSATAPLCMGFFLDKGYGFDFIIIGSVAFMLLGSFLNFFLYPKRAEEIPQAL